VFDISGVQTFSELTTQTLHMLTECEKSRFVLPHRFSDWKFLQQQVLSGWIDSGYVNFSPLGFATTDPDLNKRLTQKINQRIKKLEIILGEQAKKQHKDEPQQSKASIFQTPPSKAKNLF